MGYVVARIEELKTDLASLPPVDPATREINKLEAIRRLAGEIGGLQKKGYRIDEVAKLLTEKGVEITAPTLKQYLYRLKHKRTRRRPEQPAETSAETATPTTSNPTAKPSTTSGAAPPDAEIALAPRTSSDRESLNATSTGAGATTVITPRVLDGEPATAPFVADEPTGPSGPGPVRAAVPGTAAVPRPPTAETLAASTFKPREDSDEL